MGRETSHTKKDYQTLQELETVKNDLIQALSDLQQTISDLDQIITDVAIVDFHVHSRWRVYPQDITASPLLTAAGAANTFGGWVEIIPLNTIPFPFHVIGFCICQVSAATSYFIQIGYNTVNAEPETNMEMGERRLRIATQPIARQSELLEIYSQGVPANSRVMGRLKTASGAADTANMNIVITRHIEVEDEVQMWPAFPW